VALVLAAPALGLGATRSEPPPSSLTLPLGVLWSVTLPAPPATPPAFDDDRTYVALRNGSLVALSNDDGHVIWSVTRDSSTPLAISRTLVVGATRSTIWAADAATGQVQWETDLGAPVASGPACDHGEVAVGTNRELILVPLQQWCGRVATQYSRLNHGRFGGLRRSHHRGPGRR
jgi:hypothetical protein